MHTSVQTTLGLLLVGIMLLATLLISGIQVATGQNTEEVLGAQVQQLQDNIANKAEEIEKLEAEIKQYEAELDEVGEEKASLGKEIKQIDITRRKISTDINVTDKKIDVTNTAISELEGTITEKQLQVDQFKESLTDSIQLINLLDQKSMVELALEQRSLSDFWLELDQIGQLQEHIRDEIIDLEALQVELSLDIDENTAKQQELLNLKQDKLNQRKLVDQSKAEKDELLQQTKSEESNYKKILEEKKRLQQAFADELKEYETQLKFILDPTLLPSRGSAPLSWPLESIVVTQLFGAKSGPHRTYAKGHSGVDLRARTPEKILAMGDGVVMGTGNTDTACRGASFGKWVTVKFDSNLVATYAHLSLIDVSKGQRVKRGQAMGYTGNTGRTTAPHLHISLYAGLDADGNNPVEIRGLPSRACKGKTLVQPRAARSAYLDLLDYLPPMSADMFKSGIRR